jgi:hypothetical protein
MRSRSKRTAGDADGVGRHAHALHVWHASADEAEEPAPADDNRASARVRDRSTELEGPVAGILDQHARMHVGVEVGV